LALALRGRVADAAGDPIVGVRIELAGAQTAVRYSGLDGRFIFHVPPGAYRLSARGDCPISPSSDDVGVVQADTERDFRATAEGCVTSTLAPDGGDVGAIFELKRRSSLIALTSAHVWSPVVPTFGIKEDMLSIASEASGAHELTIDGRPALERQCLVASVMSDHGFGGGPPTIDLTTAIVFDNSVLRVETHAKAGTDAATIAFLAAVGRNATPDAIPKHTFPASANVRIVHVTPPRSSGSSEGRTPTSNLNTGF
jgi:hypothetical protein